MAVGTIEGMERLKGQLLDRSTKRVVFVEPVVSTEEVLGHEPNFSLNMGRSRPLDGCYAYRNALPAGCT